MTWIRIKDKLPPIFEREIEQYDRSAEIILYTSAFHIFVGQIIYMDKNDEGMECRLCKATVNVFVVAMFQSKLNWCLKHFTYWMPLPELPK